MMRRRPPLRRLAYSDQIRTPSITNLAGLVQHLTHVESLWFEEGSLRVRAWLLLRRWAMIIFVGGSLANLAVF